MSQKTKPTHLYSSVSVAIVMFLLGLFALVLLHSQNITNILKEKIKIVAELNPGVDPEEAKISLTAIPEIRQSSIEFIPKEDALKIMEQNMDIGFSNEENPFLDVLTFSIKAADFDDDILEAIKKSLEQTPLFTQVYFEDVAVSAIKSNLDRLAFLIFAIGLIFVFLATIIIKNTINLSMYADRWEIKTMELVGAKWNFIQMPYIKTSILIGLRSFWIATVMIIFILTLIYFYLPILWEVINFVYVVLALIMIFVLSLLITILTTHAATSKYLHQNLDSLYA